MNAKGRHEEASRGAYVAPNRHVDVDDLAVVVDRQAHVTPPTSNLHIRLVDVPPTADRMPARPGGVGEQRRESLHPPEHRDVIERDPALGAELLDVAIGEPEPRYQRTARTMISGGNRNPRTPNCRSLPRGAKRRV
jgi:hypothetical protein